MGNKILQDKWKLIIKMSSDTEDYSDYSQCDDSAGGCNSQSGSGGRSNSSTEGGGRFRRIGGELRHPPGFYDRLPYGAIPYSHYPVSRSEGRSQAGITLKIPINPISQLSGLWSKSQNVIHITVQRRNGVVTLQWEGFRGLIGGKGFRYVTANVSFKGLPIHPIEEFIKIEYRGIVRTGFIRIDPYAADVIQFHFSKDSDIISETGDSIVVAGRAITWITAC